MSDLPVVTRCSSCRTFVAPDTPPAALEALPNGQHVALVLCPACLGKLPEKKVETKRRR